MTIGAVILAAGESSRMGRPKALLEADGAAFLDRLIALFRGFCDPVVAVLGYRADEVRAGSKRLGEAVEAVNHAPERGMSSSLQCGLAALPASIDAFLFTPVDCPSTRPETVAALLARFAGSGAEVCVPARAGRNGHPVLCAGSLRAAILALPDGAPAKDLIRARRDARSFVEVDDPGAFADIDTPEDYRRFVDGLA